MKATPLIMSLCISASAFSQEATSPIQHVRNHEIALSGGYNFANTPSRQFGLNYRYWLNDQWAIKASGMMQRFASISAPYGAPVYSSDSLIILQSSSTDQTSYFVRIGTDFSFYKNFYAGIDAILGTSRKMQATQNLGLEYDTLTGTWYNCSDCVYEYYGEVQLQAPEIDQTTAYTSTYTRLSGNNFFVYGLSLNIGANFPFSDRWSMSFEYRPAYLRYVPESGTSYGQFQHGIEAALRMRI